ncbi:MAG: sensor histidine kinase [Polyangiales bacterium]
MSKTPDRDDRVEFAAAFAHELRKPLSVVVFALDALSEHLQENPDLASVKVRVDRNVDRVVDLLDELVELALVTRGHETLRTEQARLEELLRDAVGEVRALIEEREQGVVFSLPRAPIALQVAPAHVRRALVHALRNAALYSDPGGRIGIVAELTEETVKIAIEDEGPGLPAELGEGAFEPFARGTYARSAPRGLGLGLTLVRAVAELHGGRAEISERGPRQGTRLELELPRVATPGPTADRRCLLVRNDRPTGRLLELLLRSWGWDVETADGPEAAADAAEAFAPTVVLVDAERLAGDTGELARRLREMPTLAEARLVAIGATDGPYDATVARNPEPDVLQAVLLGPSSDG